MDTDQTDVAQHAIDVQSAAEPYSADWWAQRSTTELREIIKRGFGMGPAYDGALVETERRAREAVQRAREEDGLRNRRNRKVQIAGLAVLVVVLVAIGFLDWLAF